MDAPWGFLNFTRIFHSASRGEVKGSNPFHAFFFEFLLAYLISSRGFPRGHASVFLGSLFLGFASSSVFYWFTVTDKNLTTKSLLHPLSFLSLLRRIRLALTPSPSAPPPSPPVEAGGGRRLGGADEAARARPRPGRRGGEAGRHVRGREVALVRPGGAAVAGGWAAQAVGAARAVGVASSSAPRHWRL